MICSVPPHSSGVFQAGPRIYLSEGGRALGELWSLRRAVVVCRVHFQALSLGKVSGECSRTPCCILLLSHVLPAPSISQVSGVTLSIHVHELTHHPQLLPFCNGGTGGMEKVRSWLQCLQLRGGRAGGTFLMIVLSCLSAKNRHADFPRPSVHGSASEEC